MTAYLYLDTKNTLSKYTVILHSRFSLKMNPHLDSRQTWPKCKKSFHLFQMFCSWDIEYMINVQKVLNSVSISLAAYLLWFITLSCKRNIIQTRIFAPILDWQSTHSFYKQHYWFWACSWTSNRTLLVHGIALT